MQVSRWPRLIVCALAALVLTACDSSQYVRVRTPSGETVNLYEPKPFVLEDLIGRDWVNERVAFKLDAKQLGHARAGSRLVSSDGKAVPYRWYDAVMSVKIADPRIEFIADVPRFEKREYRFVPADGWPATKDRPAVAVPPAPASDIVASKSNDELRIGNAFVGVSVKTRPPAAGEGPIHAIQVRGGKWFGPSTLTPAAQSPAVEVSNYSATLTSGINSNAEGHSAGSSATIECITVFNNNQRWTLRLTVIANEPAILVDEEWSDLVHPKFELTIPRDGFAADTLFYRQSKPDRGKSFGATVAVPVSEIKDDNLYTLEPWLHWNYKPAQGNWVAMYGAGTPEMLVFGAIKPGDWFTPEEHVAARPRTPVMLWRSPNGLRLALPAEGKRRHWLIGTADRDKSLAILKDASSEGCPLPQELVIKHGDFPLDMVKDYVLDWPAPGSGLGSSSKNEHDNYPRLFVRKEELPARRAAAAKVDPKVIDAVLAQPITPYNLHGPMKLVLDTGDEKLNKRFAEEAVRYMQASVDQYTKQDSLITMGFAPHHQTVSITAAYLADVAMGTDALTPEQKRRLRAQAAFLAYTTARDDYHSPERGYSANPNMTTTARTYLGTMACLVPSHPLAKKWFEQAIRELYDVQLLTWSDENGGWLEAPHYAMVSYDYLLGMFLMARNAGFADHVYHPKMKAVAEWFAKISTPPDTLTMGGLRRHPAIGNTYMFEPSGEYGTIAGVWKTRDPKFASEMQWMFQQQGKWPAPGVGGFFPTTSAHAPALQDPAIPAVAPAYKSELFPRTGVILRNHFPTDRETQLHMILGSNHDHYDDDSGSITLWGKGRVLCDDFGYGGYLPPDQHSMVDVPGRSLMQVTGFNTSDAVDYVSGTTKAWDRQIAFIKDANPVGVNYCVFFDTVNGNAPATWRLMCTAAKVETRADGATSVGKEDVDLDVRFIGPEGMAITTKDVTQRSGSSFKNNWIETTQTGINVALPARERGVTLMTTLYPRLKAEASPTILPFAQRYGVSVKHGAGTDYVFLAKEKITAGEGDVKFTGTAGAVLVRLSPWKKETTITLWLGEAGSISYKGQTLTLDKAGSRTFKGQP